jgi:ADP-ribosyl-[dinitrogen reductase] hydrolase
MEGAQMKGTLDRATGALLGLACGDAVGTALEFKRPGTFVPIEDMVGGGPFGLRAGEWTDDTSMALCLAESVLDTGEVDLHDELRRYVLWQSRGYLSSNGRCFDIGNATSKQLQRFRRTGEAVDPRPDPEAAANGSLMRLAAVPIRWHHDVAAAAERSGESSRSTHAAQRPVDACRVLGAMVAALIAGTPAADVLAPEFWRWGRLHPEVEAVARGSWQGKEPPDIRGTGYCVAALEAAIWAVAGAEDLRSAVLRAANLGDDADTTAAIAGQLAGARWGASSIPPAWRQRLSMADRIESLAVGLHDAAVAAAAAEGPEHVVDLRSSWRFDDLVHAWWVERPAILAGEYPGSPEPVRASQKVHVLIDAGVRTFVDLTSPEDRLAPYALHVEQAADDRRLDLRHLRFPIPDLGTTTDDEYERAIGAIDAATARGGVYVHCWGGVGRTGTVVGCLLAEGGADYQTVLGQLRAMRAGTRKAGRWCPETDEQHAVVARWAANVLT